MDYGDIWNALCFRINNKNQNASERDFQIIAETFFEKLGWSQYRHEIITQKTIPIGSTNTVKPDIIIESNGKKLFVVELKKPNISISERNVEQLFSYMRLLRLNIGILLGETLQVYYELPDVNKSPMKINEISYTSDSIDGINLVKLLSKNEYAHEKLNRYCEDNIAKIKCHKISNEYIDLLCSELGQDIIINMMKEKLSTEYSNEIITSIIDEISIRISRKGRASQSFVAQTSGVHLVQKEQHSSNLEHTNINGSMSLDGLISTIGMKAFVKYYDILKNNTMQDIIHHMKLNENYTLNTLRTKASIGKKIFRDNLELKALQIISKSDRVDDATKKDAQRLLTGVI